VLDFSIASSLPLTPYGTSAGAPVIALGGGNGPNMNPYYSSTNTIFDEVRISPCVRYPTTSTTAGAAVFTPPSSAFTADGDFYNISGQMYSITGPGPTFTPIQRVYVGECVAGASSISSITSYAIGGVCEEPWGPVTTTSTNTTYSFAHNLGTRMHDFVFEIKNVNNEYGFLPGDITQPFTMNTSGAYSVTLSSVAARRRTVDLFGTGNTQPLVVMSLNSTNTEIITAANWMQRRRAKRRY
jgi:hypothetical protein